MAIMEKKNGKNLTVFFDFDNTITMSDVIDDMLERFSKDDGWKKLEEKWQREPLPVVLSVSAEAWQRVLSAGY